jgi:hypothetical protein
MVGQSLGVFIYLRNLMLVRKAHRRAARTQRRAIDHGSAAGLHELSEKAINKAA